MTDLLGGFRHGFSYWIPAFAGMTMGADYIRYLSGLDTGLRRYDGVWERATPAMDSTGFRIKSGMTKGGGRRVPPPH
jgi:hypothetical protein